MAETHTTTLSRQWLFKTSLFTLVLLGFGVWALLDAAVLYPKRGTLDASYRLKEWLDAAGRAGRLSIPTMTIADPRAAFADLERRESELRAAAAQDGGAAQVAAIEVTKLEWLRSLQRVWQLNPGPKPVGETSAGKPLFFDPALGQGFLKETGADRTTLAPDALRKELAARWTTSKQPTPLSGYDLPVQWIFTALGFGGGLWLMATMIRARMLSRRFAFESETQRLSLPSGAAFTPADLADIDKRLWHKYYVVLTTRDGVKHKLDLLRFSPLEDWILAMERTAFPESARKDDAALADTPPEAAETTSAGA